MRTRILFSSIIGTVLVFGVSASVFAASSVFDITYPIPELGSCADRLACKAYCNDAVNQSVCEVFAQDHGIIVRPATPPPSGGQGEGQNQGTALQSLEQDGGPGQCASGAADPQASCRAYCDASAHIQECVQYGKDHGLLKGDQLSQAEKVAAALKRGIPLPSGCTDQASCKQTCESPSSLDQAKSCFAFGKAAGLLPPGFDESKAEKVFSAVANGTAPFSSMKDFQQCEHPTDSTVIKKCTDFAVQNGLMTQQQADVLQETGGKGPGGCSGQDACEQYCANYRDECFQFSQEHNLVTPEQKGAMQRAASQMQNALSRAPDSVRQCLVSSVGKDTLDAITSGTKPGTPQLGQAMQQCFEQSQHGSQMQERQGPPPQGFDQGGAGPQPNGGPGNPPQGQQGFIPPNGRQGPGRQNHPQDGRGSGGDNSGFYPMPPGGPQGDQGRRFMPPQNGDGNENAWQWQQNRQGVPSDQEQGYLRMNYEPRPQSGPGQGGGYGDQNLGGPSMPPGGQSGQGGGEWSPLQGQPGGGGGSFMMPPSSDLNNPPPGFGQMPPPGGMEGVPPQNTVPAGEVNPPPPPPPPSSPTSFSYPFNTFAAAAFLPFITQ